MKAKEEQRDKKRGKERRVEKQKGDNEGKE